MSTDYKLTMVAYQDSLSIADLKQLRQGIDPVWPHPRPLDSVLREGCFPLTNGKDYVWVIPDLERPDQIGSVTRFGANDPRDILAFLMDRYGVRFQDEQGWVVSQGYE